MVIRRLSKSSFSNSIYSDRHNFESIIYLQHVMFNLLKKLPNFTNTVIRRTDTINVINVIIQITYTIYVWLCNTHLWFSFFVHILKLSFFQ